MTNEEMALAIGRKILDLINENAALSGILRAMKQPDGSPVPWKPMLKEGIAELELSPTFHYKCEELQNAIPAESGRYSALQRLYQHFLGQVRQ